MFQTIINNWRESTKRIPIMSVEEKCRLGMEISYMAVLTQDNVMQWTKQNISSGTSVFLQLLEETPGYCVFRQSVIIGEDHKEIKVRTIYAIAIEEGLKVQLLSKNGCILYQQA